MVSANFIRIQLLKTVVEHLPRYIGTVKAYYLCADVLGPIYVSYHLYRDAIIYYDQAMQISPQDTRILLNKGFCFGELDASNEFCRFINLGSNKVVT
jgi:hypothetical protein